MRSFSLNAVLIAALALVVLLPMAIEAAHAQAPVDEEFVIRNVKIFDGTRVIEKAQVGVANGKIKAIGTDVRAPATVQTIDGQGGHVAAGSH